MLWRGNLESCHVIQQFCMFIKAVMNTLMPKISRRKSSTPLILNTKRMPKSKENFWKGYPKKVLPVKYKAKTVIVHLLLKILGHRHHKVILEWKVIIAPPLLSPKKGLDSTPITPIEIDETEIYYPVLTSLRIIYPCIYIHITSILKMYFKSID